MGHPSTKTPRNHVYFFVPSDQIDVVVLASYLKEFSLDNTATIAASRHPNDPDIQGFTVGAAMVLGREALQDIITDSSAWAKEQASDEYQESPYDYSESDTWGARKRRGQTPERKDKKLPTRPDPFARHNNASSATAITVKYPSTQQRPNNVAGNYDGASVPSRHARGIGQGGVGRPRITTEPSDKNLRDRWWHERADSVEVTLKKPYAKRSVDDTITGLTATIVIDSQAQSSFIRARIAVALEARIDSPCDEKYEGASKEPLDVIGLLALEVSWDFNGRRMTETVTFRVVKDLTLPIIMSTERAKHLELDQVARPVERALVANKVAPIKEVPSTSLPPTSNKTKEQNKRHDQQASKENKKRDDAWDAQKKAPSLPL